jgi:hypothetical protein
MIDIAVTNVIWDQCKSAVSHHSLVVAKDKHLVGCACHGNNRSAIVQRVKLWDRPDGRDPPFTVPPTCSDVTWQVPARVVPHRRGQLD